MPIRQYMKKVMIMSLLMMMSTSAWAAKDCNELVTEIKAKLDAKGVKNYDLQIVDKAQPTELKIVGTCEGGTKKITYIRN